MAIIKRSYDKFDYLLYEKKAKDDFSAFRQEMQTLERMYDSRKDIIIDLTKCDLIISPEIGALAKIASVLRAANHCLRLAVSPSAKAALEQMGLVKQENVILYDNVQDLLTNIRTEQETGAPPAASQKDTDIVPLQGILIGQKVKELSTTVQNLLKGSTRRIILDLSKVEQIDTLCIGELLHMDELAKNSQKSIILAKPAREVLDMLKEASLDQVLEISVEN